MNDPRAIIERIKFRYGAPVHCGHAKHPGRIRTDVHVGGQGLSDGDAEPRDGREAGRDLRIANDARGVPGPGQGAIRRTYANGRPYAR